MAKLKYKNNNGEWVAVSGLASSGEENTSINYFLSETGYNTAIENETISYPSVNYIAETNILKYLLKAPTKFNYYYKLTPEYLSQDFVASLTSIPLLNIIQNDDKTAVLNIFKSVKVNGVEMADQFVENTEFNATEKVQQTWSPGFCSISVPKEENAEYNVVVELYTYDEIKSFTDYYGYSLYSILFMLVATPNIEIYVESNQVTDFYADLVTDNSNEVLEEITGVVDLLFCTGDLELGCLYGSNQLSKITIALKQEVSQISYDETNNTIIQELLLGLFAWKLDKSSQLVIPTDSSWGNDDDMWDGVSKTSTFMGFYNYYNANNDLKYTLVREDLV